MRKLATALAAVGIALGASALPAMAQSKAKAAAPAKKKVAVKKAAPKASVAGYKSKCKPGFKWNAKASLTAGACEKVAYKAKGKAKSKVVRGPKAAKAKRA